MIRDCPCDGKLVVTSGGVGTLVYHEDQVASTLKISQGLLMKSQNYSVEAVGEKLKSLELVFFSKSGRMTFVNKCSEDA
jgi:hypothetical protein